MRLLLTICTAIVLTFFQNCSPATAILKTRPVLKDSFFLGNFIDDHNTKYTITTNSMTQHPGVKYNFISYNKKEQYLIAQNDTSNISDAGLFTRIDFIKFNDMEPWQWGFCYTAYKAPTMEDAIKTAAADRLNPKKGCGGYPFSRMKRQN